MDKQNSFFNHVSRISKEILSLGTILLYVILVVGCSSHMDDVSLPHKTATISPLADHHTINQDEAIVMASHILHKNATRSIAGFPACEYVLNNTHTRSSISADTIAYIINYPNDEGFAIVSRDRRVYPILAFSNEGNFTLENENAKVNFIDCIASYLDENISDTVYDVTENDMDGCYVVEPMIKTSLHQRSPWDKYVIAEYPGCAVGCVAVATALVMSYSKVQISYHNSTFHLKSMISAINKENTSASLNAPARIVGGSEFPSPIQPTYSYAQAVDYMAQLLYWVGKDVDMTYGSDVSTASSRDAYDLCRALNFNIPSGYASFNINEVTRYLKDNHILYLRGGNVHGGAGHAWVSDGCYFCVDLDDPTIIIRTYIHCDWGWGGDGNGYYAGDVFTASGLSYKPANYFAIKREWQ